MRYSKRLAVLLAIMASIGIPIKSGVAQLKDPAAQSASRLEMRREHVPLDNYFSQPLSRIHDSIWELRVIRDPSGCCPKTGCCDLREFLKNLGILISLPAPDVILEEAHLEILSADGRSLFRTRERCNVCGSGVSSESGDKPTRYLMMLSKGAVEAAEKLIAGGEIIRVHLKIKDGKEPVSVTLVNRGK